MQQLPVPHLGYNLFSDIPILRKEEGIVPAQTKKQQEILIKLMPNLRKSSMYNKIGFVRYGT
jgi:hypothetical protein